MGTILMSKWPEVLGFAGEPYSGNWRVVPALDGYAIDRKIRLAGWNFFFIASEVKVTCFGALGREKILGAVNRILTEVSKLHFNGLEVTGIAAKRFLGLRWTIITAHSRHVQKDCYLDSSEARQLSEESSAWARG